MQALLKLSKAIDGLNAFVGRYVIWLILAATLVSSINAVVRKVFHTSSNAFLEVQWYLFAASFLLAAGYALLEKEHVKVDVINAKLSQRTRAWIDVFGFIFFLTPFCLIILYYAIPMVEYMYVSGESSQNTGGLIRWPAWLPIPIGVALLMLQGWSELIKRFAFLQGRIADPADKPDETPPEQELINALRANEHDTPAPGNQKA